MDRGGGGIDLGRGIVSLGVGSPLDVGVPRQVGQDPLDLLHILVADSFTAAVAALQAIEHVLPHGSSGLQAARPRPAPLQLPAEMPFAGKLLRAKKTPLAAFRIGVGPFDLHGSENTPGTNGTYLRAETGL